MRNPVITRVRTFGLMVLTLMIAAVGLGQQGAVAAESADAAQSSVIFLGDSVTAGFGYFGVKENAKNISGTVNQEFPSNWYFGDNSLSDCSPEDGKTPIDQCSNNNWNGTPWSAGPWQAGPNAPKVAYSYQIAQSQDPAHAAPIENWAMTGSTPAQWDDGGPFTFQLKSIKNTTVVMTMGANPILSTFLRIKVSGYPSVSGACSETEWLGWTGWWAYSIPKITGCADQQWAQNRQSEHLLSIYKTLLQNNNNVMVLRYHRACPWSFGNWQPNGNVAKGPAAGNSCPSQTEKVSDCSSCKVEGSTSQWAQATAAQSAMNDKIAAVVGQAQAWARSQGMDASRMQMATPDQDAWSNHQAWHSDSWVFRNDTWIHPSKAGHTQLARTVTQRACQVWGQWCGDRPAWVTTPQEAPATVSQELKGSAIPAAVANRAEVDLPNVTKQSHPVGWQSRTPKICKVFHGGDLVAGPSDGTCRVTAYSAGGGKHRSLSKTVEIKVR